MAEVKVANLEEPAFYTVKSLAERWSVTTRTIKNMIRDGELSVYWIRDALRIDPADVKSYEAEHKETRSAA